MHDPRAMALSRACVSRIPHPWLIRMPDADASIEPSPWPPLSVAAALLPPIRAAFVADVRVPREGGPPVEMCAIVEDGLLGYEVAPHGVSAPNLIVGCTQDAIPRMRRTAFDPAREAGLRLATLYGRAIDGGRPRVRHPRHRSEVLCTDWATAARLAWDDIAPILAYAGAQWQQSMAACRALEGALAMASLHLAEWDPAVDFCGLARQAEYGLPLHDGKGGTGILTQRRPEAWALRWQAGSRVVDCEFSPFSSPQGTTTLLPRDAVG